MAEMEVPVSPRRPERWSRWAFVRVLTPAGTARLLAVRAAPAATEPPPETTRLLDILADLGIDPRTDSAWVSHGGTPADGMRLFVEGAVDACLLSPPLTQECRAQGIGRVLLDTTLDRPWSQYFCCMLVANREFARRRPVATKRALRAILKAANVARGTDWRFLTALKKELKE